jgi:hypothetical protein
MGPLRPSQQLDRLFETAPGAGQPARTARADDFDIRYLDRAGLIAMRWTAAPRTCARQPNSTSGCSAPADRQCDLTPSATSPPQPGHHRGPGRGDTVTLLPAGGLIVDLLRRILTR